MNTSASLWPEGVLERAKKVKILFLDVDGVLTNGQLYYAEQGEFVKAFHTLDGHGIKMLQSMGVIVAVITGRDSLALRKRLASLGVVHAVYGCEQKYRAALEILKNTGQTIDTAACMGDDWPDLPLMMRCVLAVAPRNAHRELITAAHYVTQEAGGQGAVREVCDMVLYAQGFYTALLQSYQGSI